MDGDAQPATEPRSEPGTEPRVEPSGDRDDRPEGTGRAVSALAGSVASFLLGWLPVVGPALGGIVAGYLHGDDVRQGALVGLLANVVAAIPAMLLVVLFLTLGGIGALAQGDSQAALGLVVWLFLFVVGFGYFFVLGAGGGALGASFTDRRTP